MDKPNDMFAVLFYQPEASVSELALNGITPDNTGIQDKDYYKNMKSVQEAPQFQTDGKFDEVKFNNFYDSVNRVYNTYATEDWQKQLMSNFAKDPLDWTDPFNSNVKEFNVTIDNSNRSRTSMGIVGFNRSGNPTLSMREIAQANKMRDKDGNILNFSPNSRGFFASIFAPTAVLAQYDETKMYEENGQQVMHYKGEYKLDDNGDPYYEELGDRPVYGKEVLRLTDTITTDGTTMNKYFDFMDSDGVDKSVAKTIMKTVAWVAPLFIPVVGQVYGAVGAVAGLASSLPGMLNSINSVFGINDTGYGRAISAADAYMGRFKETTSDYSQGKFFTIENMGNLITSSAGQLFSQRTVANVSQMLLAGGKDFAKSRALGQKLSLGYMALTSSTDAYNDFKAAGASDTIAGIGALASMGALYGLMSKDYFKDMLFKGQWLDENDAKGVVKRLYEEKSKEYTQAVLGLTEAEITAAETTQQGAKTLFGKLKEKSSKIWNKFVNSAFSGKAPDPSAPTKAAVEAAGEKAAKASLKQKTWSIFNTMLNRSVNEGVEETVEDVTQDLVNGIFSAGDALGFNWHDDSVDKIDFEWNLGDALLKYATSFMGGFLGGAVFEGITQLEYARDHTLRLGDLGDADSQMLYLLMQGRKDDLLDYAKIYHDKNGFLSRDLSMKEIQRTSDGKLIYAPASGNEKSQNDQMYDFLVAYINHLDNLLQNAGFSYAALGKYMSEYDKGIDKEKDANLNMIGAFKKLKVHTTMMDDMVDVAKKLIAVNEQLDNIDKWTTDPEKRRQRDEKGEMPYDDTKKSLLERKKELEKIRDEIFEHKNDYKYIRQSVFLLNRPLQRMLLGILDNDDKASTSFNEDTYIMSGDFGFENYLLLNYGKRIKNIPPEELKLYKKEYEAFKVSDKNKFSVDLARRLFALSESLNEAFSNPLNDAESKLKDTVKNDTFLREVMLGNTEIFRQYLIAKANVPIFEQKLSEATTEIDSLEQQIASIDPDTATDEQKAQLETFKEKLGELRANAASWDSAIENDKRSIAEFEAIYGDDARNMVFQNVALTKNDDGTFKIDDDGNVVTDSISKEQRVLARSIVGLSDELNEILNDFNNYDQAAQVATDETGETNADAEAAAIDGLKNTNKNLVLFMNRIQTAMKTVKDYYKRVKDNHEMNTSDLYFTAFMRQLSSLFNSTTFDRLMDVADTDDGLRFNNLYSDGDENLVVETKDDIEPEFRKFLADIKAAFLNKNYSALKKIQNDFIESLKPKSITADEAQKYIDQIFGITLGFNPIDFIEEVNDLRKDTKSYDIIDVLKSLDLSRDGNVSTLLDLLKEEKNAIVTRGASLDDYIMEPEAKETLQRAKSLLLMAQAAIQAAFDGSNAEGNLHVHDSSIVKYAEITGNTAGRLMEDLTYYENYINFLLNLTEQNEKARSGYYQKCEVNIHRNIIKQLTENTDKETSWGYLFYSKFGIDLPDLLSSAISETGCTVDLNTLNKGNYKEFKPAFVRFFSKLRSSILESEEFAKFKTDETYKDKFKDKSDEYILGQLIGEFIENKNPKLGDFGTIDSDNPLTDLSMATYLCALLNEDYETWFKSYISAIKSQDKFAPFAAQEVAILAQYQFASVQDGALNGLLDSINESQIDLTNVDLCTKDPNGIQTIKDVWSAKEVLKNIFFTQGGTGSGKTSATAYLTYTMLKQKYGDDMETVVVGPDITQSNAFKEILGLDDDHTFDLATLFKNIYVGDDDLSGLLNLNTESDETKKFCTYESGTIKLKNSVGTTDDVKTVFKDDKKNKFIFVDEATFVNTPMLKLLQNYAEKHNIKVLFYGDKTQNGASALYKDQKGQMQVTDYNIGEVFVLSSPSLGDSVRFENSAKDKNYRTIRATLSLLEREMRTHAAAVDEIIKKISKAFKDQSPTTKFEYFEDENRFVGEKFVGESDVQKYIDKLKKLSADAHEGKSNICIITDNTTKYTAGEGVKVLNPRQVQGLEFDYVIIADHKFDSDFFTAIKDLYTLMGRSKKGTVIVGSETDFKISNEAGNDSLTAPRNSSEEIKQFKDWKNEVLNEVESKLGSAPVATSSSSESSTTSPSEEKITYINPDTGLEEELDLDDELDDDDSEGKKEISGNSAAQEISKETIEENKKELDEEKKNIEVGNKYSWNDFVDWVKDEGGLFAQEGWLKGKFNNKYSIFNGVTVANNETTLKTNIQTVYRKLASAFVYGAQLSINQRNAILEYCPESCKEIVGEVIDEWNKGAAGSGRFIARSDIKRNKSLISLAVTINVGGTSMVKLIPVALVDGQVDGSVKVGTDIFHKQAEADIFVTNENAQIKTFGQDNEVGAISKPKILTKAAPKECNTSADLFVKSNTGKALSVVTDAEFLTEDDLDNIFAVQRSGDTYDKALNYDEALEEDADRKKPQRYYINIGGAKIPIMNIGVENMVSLRDLYDLACIGRYASGAAKWAHLTQRQRDIILSEMSGEDNENNKTNAAIKHMKRYMGEFNVKKDDNSAAGSRAQNARIFKKLSNDYKLLSRGDTYWFIGSLYAAIENADFDESAKSRLRQAFQENLVYWMCAPESSKGKYYYKNSLIFNIQPPGSRYSYRYLLTYDRGETDKEYKISIQRISWNSYGPGKVNNSILTSEEKKKNDFKFSEVDIPKVLAKCIGDLKNNTNAPKTEGAKKKFDNFFNEIEDLQKNGTDAELASYLMNLCGSGTCQIFMTTTRQEKKGDGTRGDKKVDLVNDYKMISNVMDFIPNIPGAMDKIVKSLAKAGHFKSGFILNNNRNITNENEKRRLEMGYANMPFLPELTVSNFAGVKGSIWSVDGTAFDGKRIADYGNFEMGYVNTVSEHGFVLGNKYDFKNGKLECTDGNFVITPEFAKEIADGVPAAKLIAVKAIDFNARTVTFVHGIRTTTCKLKDGIDVEFVTNGELKSESKPGTKPETKPKITYETVSDYDGNVIEIPSNFNDTHEVLVTGVKTKVYGKTLNDDIVIEQDGVFKIIKMNGNDLFRKTNLFEVFEYNKYLIIGNGADAYAIINNKVEKGIFDKTNKSVKFENGTISSFGPTLFARAYGRVLRSKQGIDLIVNDVSRNGRFYNSISTDRLELSPKVEYALVSVKRNAGFNSPFTYTIKDNFGNYYTFNSVVDLTETMYDEDIYALTDDIKKKLKRVYPEISEEASDAIAGRYAEFVYAGNNASFDQINSIDPNIKAIVNKYGELIFERVQPDTTNADLDLIKKQKPDVTIVEVDEKPVSEELEARTDSKTFNTRVFKVIDGDAPKTAVIVDGEVKLIPDISETRKMVTDFMRIFSNPVLAGWFELHKVDLEAIANNPLSIGISKLNKFVNDIRTAPLEIRRKCGELKIMDKIKVLQKVLTEYSESLDGKTMC